MFFYAKVYGNLNVDYKILARIIAMRIEPFLPNLIHLDQTGFIGENIRLLNDLMSYTESNFPVSFFL